MKLGSHTITRLRAPFKTDTYGNESSERDWDQATELPVAGCSVQGEPSSEFTRDRNSVTIRKEVYAPVDADLLSTDRVRWEDNTYDIDGEPQAERHGLAADHLYLLLRRSEDT